MDREANPDTPNRSLEPTQHFVNALDFMHALDSKVLGGLSLSR